MCSWVSLIGLMGEPHEWSKGLMGQPTRTRISLYMMKDSDHVGEALGLSPPVVDDRGEEGRPCPPHNASTWLDEHSLEPVEWTPCRLECHKGCNEPGGVCVGPRATEPPPHEPIDHTHGSAADDADNASTMPIPSEGDPGPMSEDAYGDVVRRPARLWSTLADGRVTLSGRRLPQTVERFICPHDRSFGKPSVKTQSV
jgi:hypothetical protein